MKKLLSAIVVILALALAFVSHAYLETQRPRVTNIDSRRVIADFPRGVRKPLSLERAEEYHIRILLLGEHIERYDAVYVDILADRTTSLWRSGPATVDLGGTFSVWIPRTFFADDGGEYLLVLNGVTREGAWEEFWNKELHVPRR